MLELLVNGLALGVGFALGSALVAPVVKRIERFLGWLDEPKKPEP